MRQISNARQRLAAIAAAAGIAWLALTPATSLALGGTAPSQTGFCSTVATESATVTGKLKSLQSQLTQTWQSNDQLLFASEQKVDQQVAQNRARYDAQRDADFTKLEATAKNSDQQKAIQTYEAAVRGAITSRRSAYDAARTAFRTALGKAIADHRTFVTVQAQTFMAAVQQAFSAAAASCAGSNPQPATIHSTLQTALKAARESFVAGRKSEAGVGTQAQQLATARKVAMQQANQAFLVAMKTARTQLQTALGQPSGTTQN